MRRFRRRNGRKQMRAVRRYGATASRRFGRTFRRGFPPQTYGAILPGQNPLNLRSPVPQYYLTKLRANYVGYWNAADNTATGNFTVKANSCFHPFNTGNVAPHEGTNFAKATIAPCGFTNFCAAAGLYSYYRVLSSKISLIPIVNQIDNDTIRFCVAPIVGTSQSYANIAVMEQGPYSRFGTTQITSATGKQAMVKSQMSTHKMFGVSRKYVRDADQFAGIYNGDPSDIWYWQVIWQDDLGTVLTNPFGFNTIVEMIVMFEERNLGGLTDT